MEWTFYTVDDLRLMWRRPRSKSWHLRQFDSWDAAIAYYRFLPDTAVKAMGIIRKGHVLDLVRCLPLEPAAKHGTEVLLVDFLQASAWQNQPELILLANHCVRELGIRYYLADRRIFPAPTCETLPAKLADKYLRPDQLGESASLKAVFVKGRGWRSPDRIAALCRCLGPHAVLFPLVTQYRADGMTADGEYVQLDMEPWAYELLRKRTKQRLRENQRRT